MRYNSGVTKMECQFTSRFYDPALGRFTSPDSIIPGGVQGLDRYAYVNNAPVNFTDPSGHMPIDGECGYQGQDCQGSGGSASTTTTTSNDGNGGNDDEVIIGPMPPPACASGGMYNCPPDPVVIYPSTVTLHPFDGNVVSLVPIYDYSTTPPTIIGYRIISYANYDNYHIDLMDILSLGIPIPDVKHPISFTNADIAYSYAVKPVTKSFINQLAGLGITATCHLCGGVELALKILSATETVNNSIAFNGHIRIHDIYFREHPFEMKTPFDHIP